MTPWRTWRQRARGLKREVQVLYRAFRDQRTPWYGKAFAALVVAYAFSPIDLVPDFVPILGYLDDLVLLPLGILLAVRMIPPQVMADARAQVEAAGPTTRPVSWAGALLVGGVWLALLVLGIRWSWGFLQAALENGP